MSVACAPSMIEQRDVVDATVVELTQETFDGRSAATGFIVGKVPGAFLMGVAGGGLCRMTVTPDGAESVTLDAPAEVCKRLEPETTRRWSGSRDALRNTRRLRTWRRRSDTSGTSCH